MKVFTKRTPKEEFRPIDLTITIESERELNFFYCLFNSSRSDLCNLANDSAKYFNIVPFTGSTICGTEQIWTLLRDIKKKDL